MDYYIYGLNPGNETGHAKRRVPLLDNIYKQTELVLCKKAFFENIPVPAFQTLNSEVC